MAEGLYPHGLRVAVEGCGHGTLNAIYDAVAEAERINKYKVDVLIICGDFQAVRNWVDLEVMSCPPKYRQLGDFHEYYSGKRKAPLLTLLIGGNHEASSYFQELYHGGWVAPNMYYLGAASVIKVGNLRIGGFSGIYQPGDYALPHNEQLPYTPRNIKTAYHVRQYDVFKLYQLSSPIDVMVSHDWPANIEYYGDTNNLFQNKPWFKSDSASGRLGSPPAMSLLKKLKPSFWFSGHMHCKFTAVVDHQEPGMRGNASISGSDASTMGGTPLPQGQLPAAAIGNPDEVDLDMEDTAPAAVADVIKNPDELDLDLDDAPEPTAATATKPAGNPDELDLDLEDAPEPTLEPGPAHGATSSAPQPSSTTNPDELDLDDEPAPTATAPASAPDNNHPSPGGGVPLSSTSTAPPLLEDDTSNRFTRFLALDKALPKRDFLQITTIQTTPPPSSSPNSRATLTYDPEWLAIVRTFNAYPATTAEGNAAIRHLDPTELQQKIVENLEWVNKNVKDLRIPVDGFALTAAVHGSKEDPASGFAPVPKIAFKTLFPGADAAAAPPAPAPAAAVEADNNSGDAEPTTAAAETATTTTPRPTQQQQQFINSMQKKLKSSPMPYRNPQTQYLCDLLAMDNWVWEKDETAFWQRLRNWSPGAHHDGGGGGRGGRGGGRGGRGGRGGGRGGRGRGSGGGGGWRGRGRGGS